MSKGKYYHWVINWAIVNGADTASGTNLVTSWTWVSETESDVGELVSHLFIFYLSITYKY